MRTENNEQVEFWTKAWFDQIKTQPKARVRADSNSKSIERWNRRAQNYAKSSSGKTYDSMQQNVLEFLQFYGVDIKGKNVLDVGCGPGNYTIHLAREAAHVCALDPAEAMLDIVQKRARDANLNNITYVKQAWEEIDLTKEKWIGKFDLVFASMTPGVNDKETLEKLIAASKGFCYLSRFSGKRRNNLQDKLWSILSEEPDPWSNQAMDIIYPFNLLYAKGYFPSLKFINSSWIHVEDIDTTKNKLLNWLEGYIDITTETHAKVNKFVEAQVVDGRVTEEGEANMGLMVWRV